MTDINMGQAAGVVSSGRTFVSGVYFVRCGDLVKIGTSNDVYQRMSSIRTMTPLPLELLAIGAGSRAEEADLHARFAHLRQHGEWFTAAPELLAFIAQIPSVAMEEVPGEAKTARVAEEYIPVSWRMAVTEMAEIDRLSESQDRDRSSMIRILLREAIAARKAKGR